MKSFHKIVSEVAEPKAGDEKHFKDKHVVTKVDYPVDVEAQFTGGKTVKAPKRKADYDKGEDETVYEETFIIPEEILATEKNAFHTAAANAHKSGSKHFAFGGKKYPVTMSKDAASTFAGKGSMKKEAMDPVGKEDGDIDNDGDKDKSDKYLHNRRKAIGKAIRKEEAEELDEISRDLARRYIRKVADKTNTGELSTKEVMKRKPGVTLAGKKAYPGIAGEPKVRATESVELDEISDKKLDAYRQKAFADQPAGDDGSDKYRKRKFGRDLAFDKQTGRAKVRATKEEVELDELNKSTLGSYIKKANINAMDQARKSGEYNNPDQPKNFSKAMDRMRGIKKATDKLVAKEEVEQLDELSPNTLHSYIKKAAGNMAGNAAVAAAQASSSMKKSSPEVKRKIKNRMMGISGASGRLADKANMAEDAYEEIPMMMSQLEFICYAAEEIMDYLEITPDPEEWYQNKLANVHQSMMSLYSYARGEMRMTSRSSGSGYYDDMGDMYGEETELEEDISKMSHGRLKWHMNSGVPHGRYTKDEMKAERDRRLKTDPMGYRSAKAGLNEVTQTAMKKTVSYIDPKGHSRTRDVPVKRIDKDENGQEKIRESVEILDEAFKVGIVKLKDGGSVVLKKEDVDLLNKMFKDLSASNRKKMQEVAMKDKAGFEEILSFAREAI